ncbi:GD23873 [Drosophila simulans]|nr:GD23873 [Drosophila simulans]
MNSPIVKAKKVAALPQQKVMLVHKVPLKKGDDDDDSMDDLESDEDDYMSSGEDFDMGAGEKIVKFASTAEVREIVPEAAYKNRQGKSFANNIKSRLGMVSKLHATKKTYNLKASPARKPQARLSPVKGKTIRMRSDELFSRQDTMPVHRRLGKTATSAPLRAPPAPPHRQQRPEPQKKYVPPRRHNSMNAGHSRQRDQSGSVFDRLGFNNSM